MKKMTRRGVLAAVGTMGAGLSAFALPGATLLARAEGDEPPAPGQRKLLQVDHGITTRTEFVGEVVYQTSFEEADPDWRSDSSYYSTYRVRTGSSSLLYRRTNSASYDLPAVEIPIIPGAVYEAEAWASTSGLSAAAYEGARFGLEGRRADGSWIRGAYSGNVRSYDWLKMQLAYEVPADCGQLTLTCYLYKGITGSAWFDDITVRVRPPRILQTELHEPNFRGLLLPTGNQQMRLVARVDLDTAQLDTHQVRVRVLDASDAIVHSDVQPAAAMIDFSTSTQTWATGDLRLQVELTNDDGVVEAEEWGLRKVTTTPANHIDQHGRLIRNGEPYFPIGVYDNVIDTTAMAPLAAAGINTLLCYRPIAEAQVDQVAAAGLNLVYSLKDHFYDVTGYKPSSIVTEEDEATVITSAVTSLRDHPALLGWYVNDELDPIAFGDRLINHYELISGLDPDHPTFAVHFDLEPASLYLRSSDVIGADKYPLIDGVDDDLSECAAAARTVQEILPTRGKWHVCQGFSRGVVPAWTGRFPTVVELRSMAWQWICEGATGIFFYGLHQMRKDTVLPYTDALARLSAVTGEIAALTEPLLSRLPTPTVTVATNPSWLSVLTRATASEGYLFTVNHSADASNATFSVPAAVELTVIGENRTLPVSADGSATDSFAAWQVHLYRYALPTLESLADQTEQRCADYGAPGWRGVAAALNAALRRGGSARSTVEALDIYRSKVRAIEDRHLSPEDVTVLTRLSTGIV